MTTLSSIAQKDFVYVSWRDRADARSFLRPVSDQPKLVEQAQRIKQLREARRLSQDKVARAIDVTPRAYQAWEHGKGDIAPRNLIALAEFFDVSPDWIEYGRIRSPKEDATMSKTLDFGAAIIRQLDQLQTEITDLGEKLERLLQTDQPDLLPRLQAQLDQFEALYGRIEGQTGSRRSRSSSARKTRAANG